MPWHYKNDETEPGAACAIRLPSFGCFDWVSGLSWAKNGCFWPKLRGFGTAPSDLAANNELGPQTLDLGRAYGNAKHGSSRVAPNDGTKKKDEEVPKRKGDALLLWLLLAARLASQSYAEGVQ